MLDGWDIINVEKGYRFEYTRAMLYDGVPYSMTYTKKHNLTLKNCNITQLTFILLTIWVYYGITSGLPNVIDWILNDLEYL